MTIQQLSIEEQARYGATHKAVISYANGDFTAAATSQSWTLAALVAGHKIANAFLRVPTLLSGGSVSAASVTVGDTGTANAFITATDVFTGGVIAKAGDGAGFNQAGGKMYVSASNLVVALGTTTANVSTLTAGELDVYFSLAQTNNV